MKKDFLYVLNKAKKITGEEPCKKKVQKLIYLIENTNGKFGYEYFLHFYGPYSAQLNEDIHALYYEDILEIKHKGNSHCLSTKLENFELKNPNNKDLIDAILKNYAPLSPNDLERITTTLYVMQNITQTENDIIQKVIDIKGSKYSIKEISNDIQTLKKEILFELKK